jgi:hypothetical protein
MLQGRDFTASVVSEVLALAIERWLDRFFPGRHHRAVDFIVAVFRECSLVDNNAALFATTHARNAGEVERKLSNLVALFARSGSSSDRAAGRIDRSDVTRISFSACPRALAWQCTSRSRNRTFTLRLGRQRRDSVASCEFRVARAPYMPSASSPSRSSSISSPISRNRSLASRRSLNIFLLGSRRADGLRCRRSWFVTLKLREIQKSLVLRHPLTELHMGRPLIRPLSYIATGDLDNPERLPDMDCADGGSRERR